MFDDLHTDSPEDLPHTQPLKTRAVILAISPREATRRKSESAILDLCDDAR
jgi:hypothetical protein